MQRQHEGKGFRSKKSKRKNGAMPSKHVSAIDGVDKTPLPFYQKGGF